MRAAPTVDGLALDEARLIADLRAQLEIGVARSERTHSGRRDLRRLRRRAAHVRADRDARVYAALTGDRAYDAFATRQRDWALGANPWGASFMIGVGTDFPRCPQHVIANLLGSLDGSGPNLRGAVVNGPNSTDLFTDGLGEFFEEGRTCPASGVDGHAPFNGHGSSYVDDVRSWQTVEPAIDFTAVALLAFALHSSARSPASSRV